MCMFVCVIGNGLMVFVFVEFLESVCFGSKIEIKPNK